MGYINTYLMAYRLRWKRRRLLFRAYRKRHQLTSVINRTAQIKSGDILCFVTLRNEILRLPYFLEYYRNLGVKHFLIVDNASTDFGPTYLMDQPDVSVWRTGHSYRLSRFGMDWLTWLQMQYAHGHWTLTVDADELLIYPNWQTRDLTALAEWLDRNNEPMFGAMMIDLYPQGRLEDFAYQPGQDPTKILQWFDHGNYQIQIQDKMQNLWIQGGPRMRHFFARDPRRAPTLNKVPFVKWDRSYAYNSSTHNILPRHLNHIYAVDGSEKTSGVLLHTKFLPTIAARSVEEMQRKEHFENSNLYTEYYKGLVGNPTLKTSFSTKFTGWRQMESLGLMSRGGWV